MWSVRDDGDLDEACFFSTSLYDHFCTPKDGRNAGKAICCLSSNEKFIAEARTSPGCRACFRVQGVLSSSSGNCAWIVLSGLCAVGGACGTERGADLCCTGDHLKASEGQRLSCACLLLGMLSASRMISWQPFGCLLSLRGVHGPFRKSRENLHACRELQALAADMQPRQPGKTERVQQPFAYKAGWGGTWKEVGVQVWANVVQAKTTPIIMAVPF